MFVPGYPILISVRELSVSQTGLYQKCLDFQLDSSVVSRLEFSLVTIREFNN